MSRLDALKTATSLHDLAQLLNFKPKAVSYILYKQPAATKYTTFEIPKRNGGHRTIKAPVDGLKLLQRRLSDLLQDCVQEINEAKKVLASEATALLHGRPAAEEAAKAARTTFEEGGLAEALPTVEIKRAELEKKIGVLSAYVRSGLVASTSEARRQIKGGGLKVNDAAVTDDKMMLTPKDLTPEGVIKLSLGRKKHVLLKPI